MSRVLTAMSGGVDSAVTAALLMQAGHTVGGATMVLHDSAEAELADACRSAERLGIEFHEFHWREEFFRLVQTPFIRTYQAGQTPNPCVICNKTVKFGLFLDEAHALGYDKMATGHYARIERDRGCCCARVTRQRIRATCSTASHRNGSHRCCCRWAR